MRSGSATELSAYTYQRAIKLTPFEHAPKTEISSS